jgi:AraC-like DNA-binding protein
MQMLADEQERLSDSPYVDLVMSGRTVRDGRTIRPAETHWHMVCVRHQGGTQFIVVGPLTTSGVVTFTPGVEILWIRFRLGTYMPHLPHRDVLNVETMLPGAASRSFWLKGSAWQFPNYENTDTFVSRLACQGVLAYDPVVEDALRENAGDIPSRTVRHRFLRATGLTRAHIRQAERAAHAAALLRQGRSILDTVDESGYFDQPHLTRALKRWVGYTPAQLARMVDPACHSVQDSQPLARYHDRELAAVH